MGASGEKALESQDRGGVAGWGGEEKPEGSSSSRGRNWGWEGRGGNPSLWHSGGSRWARPPPRGGPRARLGSASPLLRALTHMDSWQVMGRV